MPSEVRKLRQLEEENFGLKRLVADLTLDKTDITGELFFIQTEAANIEQTMFKTC